MSLEYLQRRIEVDFTGINKKLRSPLPTLTTLDVSHRSVDAILCDSELPDGTRFSKSEYPKRWGQCNLWNATGVYELCPIALVLGMWGSPDKPGGLGAKFERAFVSEVIAVDVEQVATREGFCIDPLRTRASVLLSEKGDGTPEVGGGKVRPSELNHCNIIFESRNGGVRSRYLEQTTFVSLGALRKLGFPLDGKDDVRRNDARQTVLRALALCAVVLVSESGTSLRSRCNLVPEAKELTEMSRQSQEAAAKEKGAGKAE